MLQIETIFLLQFVSVHCISFLLYGMKVVSLTDSELNCTALSCVKFSKTVIAILNVHCTSLRNLTLETE